MLMSRVRGEQSTVGPSVVGGSVGGSVVVVVVVVVVVAERCYDP